jgi:hypothetical protein
MGDDTTVSEQIEELRQQLHNTAERTDARMAGVEQRLTRMADAMETVYTIGFQRGEAHAEERMLTLAPEPGPRPAGESAPGSDRRRRAAVMVCAATALLAGAWYTALGEGDTPSAPVSGGGGLTVTRDQVPHGPPWYPVTPRPNPAVTDIGATARPGGQDAAGRYGPAYGVGGTGSALVPGPGQSAAPMVSSQPTAEPDCRFDVKIRRFSVCRRPAEAK